MPAIPLSISLASYMPAVADIPAERVLTVRAQQAQFLAAGWPDLDTRPNSVYGDLILTPQAYLQAAMEIAAERMISDFNLANVASGIIWSCPVVEAFLANFATSKQANLKAAGVVRLAFSANTPQFLDGGTLFLFGTGTGVTTSNSIFTMRLPLGGPLQILAANSLVTNSNQVVLTQTSAGVYVVDVPVIGVMPTAVSAGDVALLDRQPTSLLTVTAVADFSPGTPVDSLPVQAARTQQTYYSSSLASRGGAIAFTLKEFPGATGASAAISGDLEMLRDTINASGLADGRLDLFVQSSQALTPQTQVVQLTYNSVADKFIGQMQLAEIAQVIESIESSFNTAQPITYTIYSQSLNPSRAPLASCAYSNLEALWLVVNMPRDSSGLPLITPSTDGVNYWSDFIISYLFDPILSQVAAVAGAPNMQPVNVDVLVRSFVPIVISGLNVQYIKPTGSQVNLTQARTEILNYFANLTYPSVYLDSKINDSMMYAGAAGTQRIGCQASVQWSVASAFLPASAPSLLVNYTAAAAAAIVPPALTISNTSGLTPAYRDVNLGQSNETLVAAGKRNLGYYLPSANLAFTEIVP